MTSLLHKLQVRVNRFINKSKASFFVVEPDKVNSVWLFAKHVRSTGDFAT